MAQPHYPWPDRGQANGVATLDGDGKVPSAQLPASGGWPTGKLSAPVTCAVSDSYCTIFSVTPSVGSTGLTLYAFMIIDPDSTSVAPQFRVSSADAGYTGRCTWTLYAFGDGTTAPAIDNVAIGTNPADTADTGWGTTTPHPIEVRCGLLADADPGAILIEWQLETSTTPTQTVLDGSYYTLVTE